VVLAGSEVGPGEIGDPEAASETLSIAEAARQLGVSRPRVYALLRAGQLESVLVAGTNRVTTGRVLLRRERDAPTGAPLSPSSAWAVLALAAGDPAILSHLAGRLSATDRSRSRVRLLADGLLALVPRLGRRAVVRRFSPSRDTVAALASDRNIVLAGVSAAATHGWTLADSDRSAACPELDGYLSELSLADVVERYELEPDDAGQVVLRAVREPWPFPPQLRVAAAVVAALDLAESRVPALAAAGRARLAELENTVEPSWRRRHAPKPPLRALVAAAPDGTSSTEPSVRSEPRQVPEPEFWDDRATTDVKQLVALLFVAAEPLTRAELTKELGIGQTRLARACALARPLLGRLGLMLIEHGEELSLATSGECSAVVQRLLEAPSAEPLSGAALQVLAIVAYEQPVTRADISRIRGVDSDGVVTSLLSKWLVAEDRRFAVRGGPLPLMTTTAFLRHLGLDSLRELPPLAVQIRPPLHVDWRNQRLTTLPAVVGP
jgi:segregation and condensation protein B